MKAAFQGVHGAYSELASRQLLGPRTQTVPCESFQDVFDAVASGQAERGVLPIENSLAGSIHQNYDLLLERNLHIVGEAHLKVEHVLMCHPSASLRTLTEVRSHPQALAQCSRFFAASARIRPVVYFDTAGAAESLVKEVPRHIGAIASAYAAELYGLKTLKRNLQNQPNNFTRFLAVAAASGRGAAVPRAAAPRGVPLDGWKTSIAFMPDRNRVGVLAETLGVFASRGIDLLKIESRPNPLKPFEYWFYLDFAGAASPEGRTAARKSGAEGKGVNAALEELRGMTSRLKLLGSYPRAFPSLAPAKVRRSKPILKRKGR